MIIAASPSSTVGPKTASRCFRLFDGLPYDTVTLSTLVYKKVQDHRSLFIKHRGPKAHPADMIGLVTDFLMIVSFFKHLIIIISVSKST